MYNFKKYLNLLLLPIGVLLSYLLYQTEWFSFSVPAGYWLFATIIMGSIGSILMLLKYIFDFKVVNSMMVLYIGVSLGLYGPLALGRSIPYFVGPNPDPDYSSEIHALDLSKFDLPLEALPIIDGVSDNYQIYIESIDDSRVLVLASANVGPNDFSTVSESIKYPETLLSFNNINGNSIKLLNRVVLSQLDSPLYHTKDMTLNGDNLFISSIGIDSEGCQTMQLWRFVVTTEESLILTEQELVFESTPKLCGFYSPHQSGGRIIVLGENTILLSVGDFRMGPSSIAEEENYTGRPTEMIFPNTYGMMILIDLESKNYLPYTIGHRNPQGLFLDQLTGNIWSSEHGPSGGGELNLIIQGNNYGWPDVTLGIPYGPNFINGEWNTERWSNHDGFVNPILSWIPSVAPSQLVVYYGEEFEFWSGDILISTLRDRSIRRLRVFEERVLYDERIYIGERIRDLLILDDGSLLMSFDSGQLGILTNSSN